jgi:hypothetical protein
MMEVWPILKKKTTKFGRRMHKPTSMEMLTASTNALISDSAPS